MLRLVYSHVLVASGICLPLEQWKELRKHVKAIDAVFGIAAEQEEEDEEGGEQGVVTDDKENKVEGEVH